MSKIFVVGSINVDYVMEITHLPLLGETLLFNLLIKLFKTTIVI